MKTISGKIDSPFVFTNNRSINSIEYTYSIHGEMNSDRSNVILLGHGFSCSTRFDEWWNLFFRRLDTSEHCFICINSIGSCFGSSGPMTNKNKKFPETTIEDHVNFYTVVLDALGIEKLKCFLGASLGGMQALDFALRKSNRTHSIISACGISFPTYHKCINELLLHLLAENTEFALPKKSAVAISRFLAKLSYTCEEALAGSASLGRGWDGASFQRIMKESKDFSGYFSDKVFGNITHAINKFDVDADNLSTPLSIERGLKFSLVGILSDHLTPPEKIRALADKFNSIGVECVYEEFESSYGHESWILDGSRFYDVVKKYI